MSTIKNIAESLPVEKIEETLRQPVELALRGAALCVGLATAVGIGWMVVYGSGRGAFT